MWAREGPVEATRHLPRVSTWRAPVLWDALPDSSEGVTSRALPDRGQSVHWYKRPSQSRHTHTTTQLLTRLVARHQSRLVVGGDPHWSTHRPILYLSGASWRPGYRVGWPLVPSWDSPQLPREDRATAHHTHAGSITSNEAGGNDPMAGNLGDIRTADNMSDIHCIHRFAVEHYSLLLGTHCSLPS